jgi:hypothetical protein
MTDIGRRAALRAVLGSAAALACGACRGNDEPFTCVDITGLASEDVIARATLAYVDESKEKGKACSNCQQYLAPSKQGCATCKVLKGPIHPKGYCKSYAPTA